MRVLKTIAAAAFIATLGVTVPSIGNSGAAQAKAHAKPGKPGRCGVGYYYSKKERSCLNAAIVAPDVMTRRTPPPRARK